MQPKTIVIAGAGFAGNTLSDALQKQLPNGWELLVVSEESHTQVNTLLAGVVDQSRLNFDVWSLAAGGAGASSPAARQLDVGMYQLRRADGEQASLDESVIALEDPSRSHVIWIARDVTEARHNADALKASEARRTILFEQSPLPMCYSSEADGFATTQWNRAWFDTFGFDAKACQGKTGVELNVWVNPSERRTMLESSASGNGVTGVEVQMRRANGELCWMALTTRIFREPQGALVLVNFFDVTEARQAQQEILELNSDLEARVAQRTAELQRANQELSQTLEVLRQAKDQLVQSEKLAALGSLVAGVAHELNTPIGNGLTIASSLEERVQKFSDRPMETIRRGDLRQFLDDSRQAADILMRNLTRAGALVMSFKQVAIDRTSSQRRRFGLASLVSETLMTLTPAIRRSACAVTAAVDENLYLESYPGPLGQVLTNLVNNALVHGYEPGQNGSIKVSAWTQDDQRVLFEVRDDGRGIHPDNLHRVFDPFFTTRLGQGGSGLGLHIVHNIVTGMLGGCIEVISQPGQGAAFLLKLPLTAPYPQH